LPSMRAHSFSTALASSNNLLIFVILLTMITFSKNTKYLTPINIHSNSDLN
jgi:hypothetical protein